MPETLNGTAHNLRLPSPPRTCAMCPKILPPGKQRHCGRKCRQASYRARLLHRYEMAALNPMHMAYADPHYLLTARKRYPDHPLGEVDQAALIKSLCHYDGWALSCSKASLPILRPLCDRIEAEIAQKLGKRSQGVTECYWFKNVAPSPRTRGIHCLTEAVLVKPGRMLRPGVPDFIQCQPARGGGDLCGRKPLKFCHWLFDLLRLLPGDELVDVFPGTGIVGKTWYEVSRVPE